jgi:hypothetical protein
MQLLYGADRDREALAHCNSQDWAALDALTKECIAELQPANIALEKCKGQTLTKWSRKPQVSSQSRKVP